MKTFSLNCRGKLIPINTTLVMGILNLTIDSFFDGGKYLNEQKRNEQIKKIVEEGADIIDLGAMSSRPKAIISEPEKELEKLLPAIDFIKSNHPNILISVDTLHASVAQKVLENGVDIINDISGGMYDDKMVETVANFDAPYILMHMIGTPQTMQNHTNYKNIIHDMIDYFNQQIDKCYNAGIKDVIIDIGIGFSKNIDQNYYLLKNLDLFKILEKPLMVGLSNKSLIYQFLNIDKNEAQNGTTVLNTLSIINGANILRVHDVKSAKQTVLLLNKLVNVKA